MMTEKYYAFAGLEISARIPEENWSGSEGWLAPFRVASVRDPHRFTFQLVEQLPQPCGEMLAAQDGFLVMRQGDATVRYIGSVRGGWEQAYIRAEHSGKDHTVLLKQGCFGPGDRIGGNTLLTAMAAEHLIARNRGFMLHCAYIEHDGKAILFTAPSGTGKSTQAELWKQHRNARIINGDRAAVRIAEKNIMAAGVPFAGSSQYCENVSLPLAAVVYLSQAPRTKIRKLRGYEAFARIWEGLWVNTWDKADMESVTQTAQRVAREIPVYHLACTPDETAVIALEEALRGNEA